MEKTNIRAYTLQELANVLVQHGEKAFRAKQIWQWLWQKGITRFEDMTNLSKDFREFLDTHFILQTATLTHKQESRWHDEARFYSIRRKPDRNRTYPGQRQIDRVRILASRVQTEM